MKTEIKVTELEKEVLLAGKDSDFTEEFEIYGTWMWEIQDLSGIDSKQFSGITSSLIKKGLITIFDNEGFGRSDDMVLALTKKGAEVYNQLLQD